MEIWICTRLLEDFADDLIAAADSESGCIALAEAFAGEALEWEDQPDGSREARANWNTFVLRGPVPLPFLRSPDPLPEMLKPILRCGALYGSFSCDEPAGHEGTHKSGPGGWGDGKHGSIEWPR